MPLGGLLVGVGHPQGQVFPKRPGIDHQPNRESDPREPAGYRETAQVEEVAKAGVAGDDMFSFGLRLR